MEKILTKILKSKLFPNALQLMVVLFMSLILFGLLFGADEKRSIYNLLVWLIWWPMLCVLFLVAGRVWCAMCPFVWVSDRLQRATGLQFAVPDFLKQHGGWITLLSFFMLLWFEETKNAMDSPRNTSVIFLTILTGAVISGLFFRGHTWCRYICPLGGLSLVYARTALFKIRPDEAACAECLTKDCVVPDAEYAGCPMHLTPFAMESIANCKFCGACVKRCQNDSLRVLFEAPSKGLTGETPATPVVIRMAVLLAGVVSFLNATTSENLPVGHLLHHTHHPVFMKTLLFAAALIICSVLFRAFIWLGARCGSALSPLQLRIYAVLPMIPLLIFSHLAYLTSGIRTDGGHLLVPLAQLTGVQWPEIEPFWRALCTGYIRPALVALGLLITLWISRVAMAHESGLHIRRIKQLFALFYIIYAVWNLSAVWPDLSGSVTPLTETTLLLTSAIDTESGWILIWPFAAVLASALLLTLIVRHSLQQSGGGEVVDDYSANHSWLISGGIGDKQSEILDWLLEQAIQARLKIPKAVTLANASQEVVTFLQRTLPAGSKVTVKANLRKNKVVMTILHEGRPLTLPDYKTAPTLDLDDDSALDGIELRLAAAQIEHMSYQARLSELRCSFTLRQTC